MILLVIFLGLFALLIAGAVALFRYYRSRNASGRLLIKIPLALLLAGFALGSIYQAVKGHQYYEMARAYDQVASRLERYDEYLDARDLESLRDGLRYSKSYEEAFDPYWEILYRQALASDEKVMGEHAATSTSGLQCEGE